MSAAGIEIIDLEDLDGCPSPRYGHSATSVPSHNRLYVFGGAESIPESKGQEVESKRGSAGRVLPHSATTFFNDMFILECEKVKGAEGWEVEAGQSENYVFKWSPSALSASAACVCEVGRHFHSAVYNPADDSIYIFGGKSNGYRNDVFRFDVARNRFAAIPADRLMQVDSPPSPRWGHSAALRPGGASMLIFGGYDSNGFVHNSLYEFVFPSEAKKGFWRRLMTMTDALKRMPRRYLHSGSLVQIPRVSREVDTAKDPWYYVIVRGLQKTGGVLDDVWCLDLERNVAIQAKLSLSASERSSDMLAASYGQRCFVLGGVLYSYGGRSSADEIRRCFLIKLGRIFDGHGGMIGTISSVKKFPFKKRALLSYGSVSVVGKRCVLFFGGQSRRRVTPPGSCSGSVVISGSPFRTPVAQLLHECPDDALFVILEFLDRKSYCAIRAVSSQWSLSRLSVTDRLWEHIYQTELASADNVPESLQTEFSSQTTIMKRKCQIIMQVQRDHLESAKMAYVGKRALNAEGLCEMFRRGVEVSPADFYDLKICVIGDGATGKFVSGRVG